MMLNIAENNSLKTQMMRLWKDTFHDSDDYVNLIFENYFNPDLVEYEIIDGRVVAMLLGIPYSFLIKNNLEKSNINSDKNVLKALYLCGLAVETNYRGNSIMAKLIDKFESRIYRNFDFMFLIPANSKLLNYYENLGWKSFSFKKKIYLNEIDYVENELCENVKIKKLNFKKSRFEIGESNIDKFKIIDSDEFENIFRYFSDAEVNSPNTSIIHSLKDFKIIVEENFIANGEIYVAYNDDKISGIAFTEKSDIDKIVIKHLYCDSQKVAYKFLSTIKNQNPNFLIELFYFDYQSEIFGKGERLTYAMIKNFKLSENLKFESLPPNGRNNQILIKNKIYRSISPFLTSSPISSDMLLSYIDHNENNSLSDIATFSVADILSGSVDVSLMLD